MDALAPFGAAVVTIVAVWGITHRQFEAVNARIDVIAGKIDGKADKADVRGLADKQDFRDLTNRLDALMLEFLRWQRPPA